MSDRTGIEYADATYNPVTGCTPASEGCEHCWARRMARRLAGRCGYPPGDGFGVTVHEDKIYVPDTWKKPRRVFVCSMGDLFHEDVPMSIIKRVLWVANECSQHTFLFLTKRPERMAEAVKAAMLEPRANIWLGTTVENQQRADERIPVLLSIPAAVHWVSVEPMLGPVNLGRWIGYPIPGNELAAVQEAAVAMGGIPANSLNAQIGNWQAANRRGLWVVCGAETGPGARPMDPAWARSIRDQCAAAGVPFFLKRMSDGSCLLDGQEYRQLPEVKA